MYHTITASPRPIVDWFVERCWGFGPRIKLVLASVGVGLQSVLFFSSFSDFNGTRLHQLFNLVNQSIAV